MHLAHCDIIRANCLPLSLLLFLRLEFLVFFRCHLILPPSLYLWVSYDHVVANDVAATVMPAEVLPFSKRRTMMMIV